MSLKKRHDEHAHVESKLVTRTVTALSARSCDSLLSKAEEVCEQIHSCQPTQFD